MAATYAAIALAVATAGGVYLRAQLAEERRKVEADLNAIADLKVQQIVAWRRERFGDAGFFSQATFVARDVRAFLDAPSSASASAKAELVRWMTLLKGGDRYSRVSLFDARGHLRLMLPDDRDRPGPTMDSHITDLLRDPRVRMTDLHRGDTGNIHLNLAIPVFAPATTGAPVTERSSVSPRDPTRALAAPPPIAVILLELDPSRYLYPIVQSWPTPSRTAETMLVRREGEDVLFLNELRHRKGTALALRQPVALPMLPAAMAARGEAGTREGVDYRGEPVLAAVRAVPEMPWFMVAKVDQEEIYAPLRERASTAGLVAIVFALAGGLGLIVLWRGRETAHLRNDMMERARAEAALQRERGFSDAILNSLPGVVYCYDRNFRFLRWNKNFERVLGYTAAEIARMSPLEFFAGPDKERVAARIQEVFDTGASEVEADFVAKDGMRTPYYFTGLQTEIDGTPHLVGVGVDISARKRADMALRESEERLRLATDAAHMGTFDWDVPRHRIVWSHWHEELWGFRPDEFGGTYEAFAERLHLDDLPGINAEVARCIAAREPFIQEFRIVWPDGSVHWILARGEFTFGDDGTPQRMRGAVMDISERKQGEEALHALAGRLVLVREEERTRIAREVHDVLGQLLTGLTMDMAWLQKRLAKVGDAALRHTMTDKMGEIGQLTDSMIRTVQEISSELRPSVLDNLGLGPAIQFEAGRFQERAGIACEVSLPEPAPAMEPQRATGAFRILQEVLTNVARHAQATRVSIRLARCAGDLVLEVRDNGRGITPEQLADATSLGLLGMRERASQLGGRIAFAGEPGRGTTVTITVPLTVPMG